MKLFYLTFTFLMIGSFALQSQNIYYSREARISFYSKAPLEDIEAHNNRGSSVIDFDNCRIESSVLIRGFMFEKSLMQEHFNENYMESHKYPRATFKGTFVNCEEITIDSDGTYPFTVEGELEMREITGDVIAEGEIVVENGQISGKAEFTVKVADYNIRIPALVSDNIARAIDVRIEANYQKLDR